MRLSSSQKGRPAVGAGLVTGDALVVGMGMGMWGTRRNLLAFGTEYLSHYPMFYFQMTKGMHSL